MTLSPITKLALFGIAAIALAQTNHLNTWVASLISDLPIHGQTTTQLTKNPTPSTSQDLLKNLAPIYIPAPMKPTQLNTSSTPELDNLSAPPPSTAPSAPPPPASLLPTLVLQAISSSSASKPSATISNSTFHIGDVVFSTDSSAWILHSISHASVTLKPSKPSPSQPIRLILTLR